MPRLFPSGKLQTLHFMGISWSKFLFMRKLLDCYNILKDLAVTYKRTTKKELLLHILWEYLLQTSDVTQAMQCEIYRLLAVFDQ